MLATKEIGDKVVMLVTDFDVFVANMQYSISNIRPFEVNRGSKNSSLINIRKVKMFWMIIYGNITKFGSRSKT